MLVSKHSVDAKILDVTLIYLAVKGGLRVGFRHRLKGNRPETQRRRWRTSDRARKRFAYEVVGIEWYSGRIPKNGCNIRSPQVIHI